MLGRIHLVALAAGLLALPSLADAAALDRGRALVTRNCAVCHAVGVRDQSKLPQAPPFRDLHTRYPVQMLAEALAEGILTGHPAMPEFRFTAREVDEIIAYLVSIQSSRVSSRPPGGSEPQSPKMLEHSRRRT